MNDVAFFISDSFVLLSCSLSNAAPASHPLTMSLCLWTFCTPPSNPGMAPMLIPGACLSSPFLFFLLSSQKAETLFSLLFVSYNTCLPPTYSKLTTITIQHATTVRVTATTSEHSFLELLWKHKYCWKSFLGISRLLTCSPGVRDEEFSGQLSKWMKILTTVTLHPLSRLNLLIFGFKPLNVTHLFCPGWTISLSKLHSLSKY